MPRFGWTEDELYLVGERAHSLFQQGSYSEAAAILEGAVAVDPDSRHARLALAAVYVASGAPAPALAQLEWLVRRDAEDLEVRGRYCETLIAAGDLAAAEAELGAIAHLLPGRESARLRMRLEAALRRA